MPRRLIVAFVATAVALAATSVAEARTYYGTVGPGAKISFRNAAGTRVYRVPAGLHRIIVRDRSSVHNFHLRGRGVNRATGIAFVGRRIWRSVRIYRGSIYRYVCDPHATGMRGRFRGI